MRIVAVSNRVTTPSDETTPPGGMAVGIQDALQAHGGLWLGWSGRCSDDDVLPRHRTVRDGVEYITLDLPAKAFEGYYNGFSNQVLWPLFHDREDLVAFKASDYLHYLAINERFADELARILRPDDLVWVHDYHLIPLAHALRRRGIHNRIGFFLHTPFAEPNALNALPVAGAIATALLEYDLLGFQTVADRSKWRAFHLASLGLSARGRAMQLTAPPQSATLPIGIGCQAFAQLAAQGQIDDPRLADIFAQITPTAAPIIAVDRLDYSKGIPGRFAAFEAFLDMCPAYKDHVSLVQVAPVGRSDIAAYRNEARSAEDAFAHVAAAHPGRNVAHLLTDNIDRASLAVAFRHSRVGLVTPLRDGMNLVAKEYVAAQNPEDPGVLILSRFAGAADELDSGALLVDPRNVSQVAGALQRALMMSRHERVRRWQAMIDIIRTNDAAHWASRFIRLLAQVEHAPSQAMRERAMASRTANYAGPVREITKRPSFPQRPLLVG